jgi:hypothetical protein
MVGFRHAVSAEDDAGSGEIRVLTPGCQVQIEEECLELVPENADEVTVLRRWVRRVNGPNYPQPFLQEGPPGRFRLYVGDAAERIRTARGIQ